MTTTSGCALEALAVCCEQASGPDRELDAAIAVACRAGLPAGCDWAFRFPKWEGEQFGQVRILGNVNGNGDYISGRFVSPLFTASLDAAMTLVPEGWGWLVSQPNEKAIASGLLKERTPVLGEVQYGCDHRYAVAAATPALALCAAAFRARQATSAAIGGGA